MEDLSIFSSKLFFLIEALLKKARQCICCFIRFTLPIIDIKIVTRELFSPIHLITAQILYIHELSKVIMVKKNKKLVFSIL